MSTIGQNLLRKFWINPAAAAPAGMICELELPRNQTWRRIWLYYSSTSRAIANYTAELVFSNEGYETARLPACINRLGGTDMHTIGLNYDSIQFQIASTPGCLYWTCADGGPFPMTPFDLILEADKVVLEHNQSAGGLVCFLGVLSGSVK
jgi:hypothetical protein